MTFVTVPDKSAGDQFSEAMWDLLKDNLNAGVWRPVGHAYALSGPQASFDFAAIPATWKHLKLVWKARGNSGNNFDTLALRINGSAAAVYYSQVLYAAAAVSSPSETLAAAQLYAGQIPGVNTGSWGVGELLIPNYAQAGEFPAFSSRWFGASNTTTANLHAGIAGGFGGAAAGPVTQLTLLPVTGSFVQYSMATLYAAAEV